MEYKNKWTPLIIALAIGAVVALYYIISGRSSYDLNVRELGKTAAVDKVEATNPKKVVVKCKNGESYEISFQKDQGSYDGLIFNACGSEGGAVQ
jgi:hypothetical protein